MGGRVSSHSIVIIEFSVNECDDVLFLFSAGTAANQLMVHM